MPTPNVRDSRINSTVSLKLPTPAPDLMVGDLAAGTFFQREGTSVVYVKTDETLARGYRCLAIRTGILEPIARDVLVTRTFTKVEITLK